MVMDSLISGTEPDPRALETVIIHLRIYVARFFPSVDPDDVVQGTLTRLLERSGRIEPVENAWAYLAGATRNAAIDALRARTRRRQIPLDEAPEPLSTDESLAQLIERDATHASIVESLRAGVVAGDELLVRVVTAWLDFADEFERAPTTREIAPRVGVSHTSVAQALGRFRRILAGPDGG
jgi:DNA-directed RNA polymerase specialized sigma24 family protein